MTRRWGSSSLRVTVMSGVATMGSAVCLGAVFLDGSWFLPTLAAVALVGAGCELGRRLSLARPLVPLIGLLALALYLLVRFGHQEAVLGLIPWAGSWQLVGDLVISGREDITRYAAPIGVSSGIELLTVGGVGLIAVVVDTLAVTYRRAALAGIALLVLYTVPTAIAPEGVGWLAFAVAGAAFLALLLAESRERISRWGRPMRNTVSRANWTPSAETAPLGQVGRRVGATALGLAVVIPAILPTVSSSPFGFGNGGIGGGSGGGTKVAVINPIVELGQNLRRGDNTVVIRYTGRQTYLRLVGLDQFTGAQWRPSELKVSRDNNDVEDGLTRAPGQSASVETRTRRYKISIYDLEQTWLPLPYPTTKVRDIKGTWLYDADTFNVFGENGSTRQLSYSVTAQSVRPTAAQLRAAPKAPASLRRYLRLPAGFSQEVVDQAAAVAGNAPTAYDRALAVQTWLRDPSQFTYSTTVDPSVGDNNGQQAIEAFLRTRRGYCVHFASTMAVMARSLGIPARVAVGFAAGRLDTDGRRTVGLHDLHSWPELYFSGVGWVAFEPTPGGPASAPPSWANGTPDGSTPSSSASAAPAAGSSASPSAGGVLNPDRGNVDPLGANAAGRGAGGIGAGPVRVPTIPLLITLGVLALLSVPWLTRLLVRRRRWSRAGTPSARALAAWAELQDTLVDHGYRWDPSDSPRRGAERLVTARALGSAPAEALARVVAAVQQARYAPPAADSTTAAATAEGLDCDVAAVGSALAEGSSRLARLRARLLPRSTDSVRTLVTERLADGLDAVDRAATSATRLRLRRN